MLDFFGFGRRRKSTRRKSSKSSKKIPKQLRAIAKRYGVKTTRKSVKSIKKQCRRKIMMLIKKAKKGGARRRKAAPKRRRRRARFGKADDYHIYRNKGRYAGGAALVGTGLAAYRYRRGIGRGLGRAGRGMYRGGAAVARGFRRAGGMIYRNPGRTVLTLGALGGAGYAGRRYRKNPKGKTDFGKRRRRAPAAAMFGRRRVGGRRRRMTIPRRRRRMSRRMFGFGNGGNPSLSASMGYEFCPGGGGVLGANSTGLFPSPCMAAAPAAKFGKRRRRRY